MCEYLLRILSFPLFTAMRSHGVCVRRIMGVEPSAMNAVSPNHCVFGVDGWSILSLLLGLLVAFGSADRCSCQPLSFSILMQCL